MADRLRLEDALTVAVQEGKIPHVVVCATNRDGSFQYCHATGFQNYGVDDKPIEEDAVFTLASQTKLLTAVAALKCVEQGYIGLDDDVASHLPELARLKILIGFDEEDRPVLKDRTKTITLRHLLTHTSGANYAITPDMLKYQKFVGHSPGGDRPPTVAARYNYPLMFEPGESWMYGVGLDWAGLLIERLTGTTLEEFEKKNLWGPLGITGISFWACKDSSLKLKIPQLVKRGEDGKFVPNNGPELNSFSTDCFGGHGGYARMSDFLKVQQSLLANDGKLLQPETTEELFKPQLGPEAREYLNTIMRSHSIMFMNKLNPDIDLDHALGGIVFMQDDLGRRKKGTLSWAGMYNAWWSIDREAGIAMTFGVQTLPAGDAECREMASVSELAIYEMIGLQ